MPQFDKQKVQYLSGVTQRIKSAVHKTVGELQVQAFVTAEPLPFADREKGKTLTLKPGDTWAEAVFDCAWFHFTGTVSAEAAGHEVVLLIDVNGEACVVDAAGHPRQGLTNISSEFDKVLGMPGKNVVPLFKKAKGGETIDLWVDAGANDLFGRMQEKGTLKQAAAAIRHQHLSALQWDWEVLHELMTHLPEQSARRQRLWSALDRASRMLIDFTEAEAEKARAILAPELAKKNGDVSMTISAIGHAHMDLAWLWPIRETIRKCARTFSTVLRMMERYPDYIFGASQPQQYQWMKQHYPTLYAEIKKRIAQGRWEAQGVMWVEPDTNVPSGEALVRQIIYGVRFFQEEFGVRSKILWEPDVFGYTGALPQILKKSGVDFFMTQKLSWNQVTKHPHHTFWWRGIDGSKVLAHMPPEDTYNGPAAPRSLVKIERDYLDKHVSDRALMLFGIGDGGGGPGEEHLERLSRAKNLSGVPPVVQEPSEKFFADLLPGSEHYATWSGELYLEKHQGTFTTQARNKRFNRKLELALRELEWFASAAQLSSADYSFPKTEIDEIWREFLLYQFHDILPGSSIGRVYDESLPRYAVMEKQIAQMTSAAGAALLATLPAGRNTIVSNSLPWSRTQWMKVDSRWHRLTVPSMGIASVNLLLQEPLPVVTDAPGLLENELLRVEFSADGSIASCLDKRINRQVLAGAGNVLAIYDDPGDAWDFPMDYRERQIGTFTLQSSESEVDGPCAILRQVYTYGHSTLKQVVKLTAGSAALEFITEVDWKESARMLRTAFPTTVVVLEGTCDIQFGSIRRPTHRNTLADVAKMEICGHKFVDLSDRGYGVALLNDCKYGHALIDGLIDLNLLRGSSYPDPNADRAVHHFTYALYPHLGDHVAGGVIQAGYELNVPLTVLGTAGDIGVRSWFASSSANIVIETVKPAESGAGWAVRLYEATGASTDAVITLPAMVSKASLTNLLEEHPQKLEVTNSTVQLRFGPFEIHTLVLKK